MRGLGCCAYVCFRHTEQCLQKVLIQQNQSHGPSTSPREDHRATPANDKQEPGARAGSTAIRN